MATFTATPSKSEFAKSARGTRDYVPTPFDDTLRNASNGDAFDVKVKDAAQAKEAASLLYRSARHLGRFLRIRHLDSERTPLARDDEGVRIVQIQVRDEPARQVRYTADEIREWASENGLPTTGGGKTGKGIPADTRAAFWKAVDEMDQTPESGDSGPVSE